mmetsp:Transcript_17454/g.28194  ORF Transcript_17454/g.28194 Transcript_17454/m.28194 type:complete len:236 (-) Transcript_17454:1601-2308(-)
MKVDGNSAKVLELKRSVNKHGFHRVLNTVVRVNVRVNGNRGPDEGVGQCRLAIIEKLPRTVYMDFDQIAELRRMNSHNVPYVVGIGFKGGIEVEKPAESSKGYTVATVSTDVKYTKGKQELVFSTEVDIPIHLRYQKPGESNFATATVAPPKQLFLGCGDWDVIAVNPPFQDESTLKWIMVDAPENVKQIDLRVPIGRFQDRSVVVWMTSVVTLLGALFICYISYTSRKSKRKRL